MLDSPVGETTLALLLPPAPALFANEEEVDELELLLISDNPSYVF
jgi:hypothetical protein